MPPDPQNLIALPPGFRLGEYRIDRYLGSGGFGITYAAIDENLHQRVAIKEYLPKALALRDADDRVTVAASEDETDFRWGLERFLDEARALARFDHPNIVRVKRFIEAHGTGYIVMEYVDGESLSELLNRRTTLTEAEIREHVVPVLNGLAEVHAAGLLHRDIKPGNIVIRANGAPVLIDFGSARHAASAKSRSLTAVITPGYAPLEQYSSSLGDQRPTTDIYALGAVLYRCVTGDSPPDATDRALKDRLTLVAETADGTYSPGLLNAIDTALRMSPDERPRDIAAFLHLASVRDSRRERPEDTGARYSEPVEGDRSGSGFGRTGHNPASSSRSGSQAIQGQPTGIAWLTATAMIGGAVIVVVAAVAIFFGPLGGEERRSGVSNPAPIPSSERPGPSEPARNALPVAEDESEPPDRQSASQEPPFIVRTDPPFAQVELMNVADAYARGMTLTPGRYNVRVSLPGYEPKQVWLNHSAATREHRISLDPARRSFTVEVEPPDAHVRIMNIVPAYEPGMMLAAGNYTVEVSAPGFETVTETVGHDITSPTVHRVELPLSFGQLPENGITMGNLELGDLELDTGEFADSWMVSAQAGQTLTVDMRSDDFDPMLMLIGGRGSEMLAEDDDSGLGTDARISVDISENGEYMVVATSYDVGEVGAYELRVDVSSPTLPSPPPDREDNSLRASTFTRGSHEDDVLRLQGTPTAIYVYPSSGFERWNFGYSYVDISTSSRRVTEWSNRSRNLNVWMEPGPNTTNSVAFTRGSHEDDVIRLQGTPTAINVYPSSGFERWNFGNSYVNISTSSRRVTEWSNRGGNLRVR